MLSARALPAAASAYTVNTPGSRAASQMIVARGAGQRGSSAKVEPPRTRLPDSVNPARDRARFGMPGDIAGIAPQPFPHQAGTIDPAERVVVAGVAPIRHGLPGHGKLAGKFFPI
jgi:hypothetical protein